MRWEYVFVAAMLLPCRCGVAEDPLIADFEGADHAGWTATGDAFGAGPSAGTLENQMAVGGFLGSGLVNSYRDKDHSTGTLTSPEFTIERDYLSFLIGGGRIPDQVGIELLIDSQRRRSATGADSETLDWRSWDVREFRGRSARLRIFDHATGGWGHILVDQIMQTEVARAPAEVGRLSDYRKTPAYYREPHRPQVHFTPEIHWMNDPNGLVYAHGEYHLFYQYNPHGIEWGHMSWGHAVSRDLLHWEHLPIALHDEQGVMVFSGSAVFDERNTSGFGVDGQGPLVAIYTGHGHGKQTQDLAFSRDNGRTWTKYAGNPVIDIGLQDFRDPKVFWHAGTHRWVMVVALAADKRLRFYGSPDLKNWELLSEFGPAGVVDKPNWECPDLFELPIENEPGRSRWVLEADMGNGSVAGGSGGEYFTGTFDGTTFVPDSTASQWVDFGRDFYAPVSWSNIPEADGRRIWIGWMNNWETCLNPTSPWRSAMSIPREVTLRRIDGTLRLCQRPVREVETLRSPATTLRDVTVTDDGGVPLRDVQGQQHDIEIVLEPGTAKRCGLHVLAGNDRFTEIGYDAAERSIYVDRRHSGNVTFHPAFAGRHAGPLAPDEAGRVRLRILVDACSVEVFGGQGETVITDLVFPDSAGTDVKLFAVGGGCRVVQLTIHPLSRVWSP